MILLVDVGNTRLKFAFYQQSISGQGVISNQVAMVHKGQMHHEIDAAMKKARQSVAEQQEKISRVLVSSVAGELTEQAMIKATQAYFGLSPEFARTDKMFSGLTIAYEQPAKLGVDRWLAMLAARNLGRFEPLIKEQEKPENSSVCVVDSGSALTIDVVSAKGDHQGGFIIPGLRLMYDSLLNGTREVQAESPVFESRDWGINTNQAVTHGAVFASVATVAEAYRQFGKQVGGDVALVLTGGDAQILSSGLQAACQVQAKQVPDLVLRGLIEAFQV